MALLGALGASALLLGALVLSPLAGVSLGCAAVLFVAVALRPPLAAYLILALTPLIAGIERGVLVPVLRPSEALLALVASALAVRGVADWIQGASWRWNVGAVEWSLLALAYSGSVLPLLWMVVRGRQVTMDDLLYASYIWKLVAVFAVIRISVRTERQVRASLWITLGSTLVVGVVAILQALGSSGVGALLAAWYTPGEAEGSLTGGRGSSTLSSSLAVADVMVFSLGIAAGLAFRGGRRWGVLLGATVVLTLGVVAASQVSGFLAWPVALLASGAAVGRLRRLVVVALPVAVLATLLLWPVIGERLEQFGAPYTLPRAWVGPDGRLDNLTTFFWSELFTDLNWLTGVRVAARVPAPEGWRDWVWIESGHTWLLWSGGVTFFLACFAFLAVAIRATASVARRRVDAIGAAAVGSFAALWVNVVVMTFDVHLTLRGSGELAFALLALALTGAGGPGGASRAALPAAGSRLPA